MQTWPKDDIRKQDVAVSKNYLAEAELKELNRLTTILLDIFEDQMDLGRLIVMDDAVRLLDAQLQGLGRSVLRGGGSVSAMQARQHAHAEYEKFDNRRKAVRHAEADRRLAELARKAKQLPKSRRKPG
jgi:hypothetical protein